MPININIKSNQCKVNKTENGMKANLPFELIEMIDHFCNYQTHQKLRQTSKAHQKYLPAVKKVSSLEEYEQLLILFKSHAPREGILKEFQHRIKLDYPSLFQRNKKYADQRGAEELLLFFIKHNLYYEVLHLSCQKQSQPALYRHIDMHVVDLFSYGFAGASGDLDLLAKLLKEPHHCNGECDPSPLGNTALHFAAEHGQMDSVKLLLQNPNFKVTNDFSLLGAAMAGHADIVKLLLQDTRISEIVFPHGSTDPHCSALFLAADYGHVDVVRAILQDERVDPSSGGSNDALLIATCQGHARIVELLLEKVDPNQVASEDSPLVCAIEYGHVEVVKVLLQDGRVDPSDSSNVALTAARCKGNLDIINLLLHDGRVEVDTCFFSPETTLLFLWAVEKGHDSLIKTLLVDYHVQIPSFRDFNAFCNGKRVEKPLLAGVYHLHKGINLVI